MKFQKREYQETMKKNLYAEWASGTRWLVGVLPTGGGKTYVASRIAFDAAVVRKRKVLALAHRFELIGQMSAAYTEAGVPHSVITAGRISGNDTGVQVASIQSLDAGVALPQLGEQDLIITDEAHRIDGLKIYGKYPNTRRLGITATPFFLQRGKVVSIIGKDRGYEKMVIGSTPKELLASGFLVPMKIFAPPLPAAAAENAWDDQDTTLRERIMGQSKVMGDVVETWRRMKPRPTIAFCCGVSHAKRQADMFNAAGGRFVALDGDTRPTVRRDTLALFREGRLDGIMNADLFTEGLDLPFVSRILMLRPTESPTVFLQQAGRGSRPFEGKEDCQIVDHAGNVFFHGHPYDDRVVDEMEELPPGTSRDAPEAGLWRCERCFCMATGDPDVCPYCGWQVESKGRKIKAVGGRLVEYDEVALARARADADKRKDQMAVNNARIRSLFGLFMRTGYPSTKARPMVFAELAKFNARGIPWEQFFAEAQERISKPSRPALTRSNPFLAKKSSS